MYRRGRESESVNRDLARRRSWLGLCFGLFAVVATPATQAQIIAVEFNNADAAKKYKKYLQPHKGKMVLIGEPKAGMVCTDRGVQYSGGKDEKNELWVADSARPEASPYKVVRGEKKKARGGLVLSFAGVDVEGMAYVDRLQSMQGLANEYGLRNAELESLKAEVKGHKRASPDWVLAQSKVLGVKERLINWLANMGYRGAVKKMTKELERERKTVARERFAKRQSDALESIHQSEPSERLLDIVSELGGGGFKAMQSQHFRFVYDDAVPDEEIQGALELAEKLVEGFRREFVDPYVDEDFKDHIPEGLFQEWCYVTDIPRLHEGLSEKYYGGTWGKGEDRARRLKTGNQMIRPTKAPTKYVAYFRLREQRDTEGTVAHTLGHTLANLHYNAGRRQTSQAWVEEAVGYFLSFGYLGRNSLTCFQLAQGKYAVKKPKEGEKTVELGMRGHFNQLALNFGPTMEQLSLKTLAEISDPDFAKAWSMFDFVAQKMGREGQLWMRETCRHAGSKKTFMKNWRAASEVVFDVAPDTGVDVFKVLEETWRRYAATEQARAGG